MSANEQVYNVFNKEGKILQIEYGLEAVNNALPLVVLRNNNTIVCVAKKNTGDKLEDEVHSSFQPIYENLYSAFTGLDADVSYINSRSKDIACNKSYSLGFKVTPDILCRSISDKMQTLIQSNGERPPAFGGAYFGFDKSTPIVSMTDMSAICYPCYGVAVGNQNQKMYKFLEKNYKTTVGDSELFEIAVGAILESIGNDSGWQEIEVAYLKENGIIQYLQDSEIDQLLQKIAEK